MKQFAKILGVVVVYGTVGLLAAAIFAVVLLVRTGDLSINFGFKLGRSRPSALQGPPPKQLVLSDRAEVAVPGDEAGRTENS